MTQQHTRLKYRFRAALIKVLFFLLARLSLKNNHRVGALLGLLGYLIPNRNRRITRTNIQLCFPEMDEQQQQQLVKRSLLETARTATEVVPMWLWEQQEVLGLVRTCHGLELLQQAYDKKQGVIIALPHLGNWEIFSLFAPAHYPMTAMYQPPKLLQFDELMRHSRERLGAHLVPTDKSGVKAMMSALKKGELVIILPDQEPKFGSGVFAPFFNIPAYSGTLIPRLASKTGAQVIFAYAERLANGQGYDLHFSLAPEAIRDNDPVTAVTALNQGIEACVKEIPEQYQWSYYRFKTRPEGEKSFY